MPSKKVVEATFTPFKECKHSRRFRTPSEEFPIKDTYLKREFAEGALEIKITIEVTK